MLTPAPVHIIGEGVLIRRAVVLVQTVYPGQSKVHSKGAVHSVARAINGRDALEMVLSTRAQRSHSRTSSARALCLWNEGGECDDAAQSLDAAVRRQSTRVRHMSKVRNLTYHSPDPQRAPARARVVPGDGRRVGHDGGCS